MVKILSQAGMSLADVYDVVGSVAGVEQLQAGEVSLVHEMGATIFSERFNLFVRRVTTAALLQNTDWDILLTDLPATPWRVLSVAVLSLTLAHTERAQLSVRDANTEREMPMLVWNRVDDTERAIRIVENGAASAVLGMLTPAVAFVPTMGSGADQRQSMENIAFRGRTSAFGAGTVVHVALVQLAFSHIGGISSRGLPIPSW